MKYSGALITHLFVPFWGVGSSGAANNNPGYSHTHTRREREREPERENSVTAAMLSSGVTCLGSPASPRTAEIQMSK